MSLICRCAFNVVIIVMFVLVSGRYRVKMRGRVDGMHPPWTCGNFFAAERYHQSLAYLVYLLVVWASI